MSIEEFPQENIKQKKQAKPEGSRHWEEEREKLIEKVSFKVGIIHEFKSFVKHNAELPPKEFRERLEEIRIKAFESLGPEFAQKFERYRNIKKAHDSVEKRKMEIEEATAWKTEELERKGEDADYNNELANDELYFEISREEDELIDKLMELEDNDIKFYRKIENFIESVGAKREETFRIRQEYEKNRDAFWKTASDETGHRIDQIDVGGARVVFSGHAVNIILPQHIYREIFKDSRGVHVYSTVFNFISERDGLETTIQHENNHNLTETFDGYHLYKEGLKKSLSERIKNIGKLEKMNAPEFLIENEIKLLNQFLKRYVYQNFSELIADSDQPFDDGARSYTLNFLNAMDVVSGFIKSIEDGEIRSNLERSQKEAEEKFVRHMNQLADIYFYSENFSDDAKTGTAILLFGHDELRKVEKYLKAEKGDKLYELSQAIRPITRKGNYFSHIRDQYKENLRNGIYLISSFLDREKKIPSDRIIEALMDSRNCRSLFDIDKSDRIIELVEVLKSHGNNEEVQKLIDQIDSRVIDEMDNLDRLKIIGNIKNASELHKIEANSKKLAKLFRIPEFGNLVDSEILEMYVDKRCSEAIRSDDFSRLHELWQLWPERQKEIAKAVLHWIESGWVIDDYKEYQGKIFDKKSIRKSKFWKFIVELDLAAEAEEALHSVE
jgi:hypothetical protein